MSFILPHTTNGRRQGHSERVTDSSSPADVARQVLDGLLELPLPPHLAIDVDGATVFTVGYGWYMRVRRTADAGRLLSDAGLDHEAAPLIRSMIEHAVALLWLADARDDAVTVLRRLHQHWAGNVKTALNTTSGWTVDPAMLDVFLAADIPTTSQDRLAAFKHRCEHYGHQNLYVAWLSETQESHPTLLTANAYVAELDVDRGVLRDAARRNNAVLRATPLLLIATDTMNSILPGEPWTAALGELGEQFTSAFATK
jgi:hypothetical protein